MASIDTHEHTAAEHGSHFHLSAASGFRLFFIVGIITASLLRLVATTAFPNWTEQLGVSLAAGALVVAAFKMLELIRH